jgi:hypothetical protein
MGAVNPRWHRWIFASIAKHLHAAADGQSLPLVVEMLDKRDEAWKTAVHKTEATISGPATRGVGGEFEVVVDVTIILTSDLTDNDYDHLDYAGEMASALDQCILVMDYGATGLVEIGKLKPSTDPGEAIRVTNLKPAEKDTQLHSVITARLSGYFEE